ncbi:MAG: cation:proton antiporter, partial [Gammaproteobacteria bacterium]|nr:cation:proton antiporter [Gammaproteobacteria bacterium]
MDHLLFADTMLLLAISVLAIALFSRLRLPPILGYLFVGALVGPHALAWVQDGEVRRLLGEIGVAFLLFTIGLEFSLARFRSMRDILVRLGASQVFIGTLSGAVIAWALGMSQSAAIIVGGALSLSSTALVVKQLSDQLELHARHGQLALGILLFQDLAAVPFLVLIPLLSPGGAGASVVPILLAMAKALAAVALMLAAGRWILRPFFHLVSAARYPELFTL